MLKTPLAALRAWPILALCAALSGTAAAQRSDDAARAFAEHFEGPLTGWQGRGFSLTDQDRHEGRQSLRICDSDDKAYEQAQSIPIALTPGKEYTVSVWCRPKHTTSTVRFTAIQTKGASLFKTADGGILFVEHHFDAQEREWQRGVAAFALVDGADGVRLDLEPASLGRQNTGEALFDEIVITELVLPRVPLTDAVLEADADSDGVPDGWHSGLDRITLDPDEKRTGDSSVLVAQETGRASLGLPVAVEPLVQYELSLWVKIEGDWPQWPATAQLVFTPQGGSAQHHYAPVCATRAWQRLVLRAWAPFGAHSARVVAIQVEGRTRLRLDSLSLKPVSRRLRQATAARLSTPVTIDGDLSDWPKLPSGGELQIGGVPVNEHPEITDWISFIAPTPATTDVSGLGYVAWDDAGLYFALRVSDDQLTGEGVGRSDGVRIGLTRQRETKVRRWYEPWLELPLPASSEGPVQPYRLASEVGQKVRPFPQVKAAARTCAGGYVMEVSVPFSVVVGGASARAGQQLGLELLLLDRDPGHPAKSEQPHAVNWRPLTVAPEAVYEAINQWHPKDCGVLTLAEPSEPVLTPGAADPAAIVKPLPARTLKPVVARTALARDGMALAAIVVPIGEEYARLGAQIQAAVRQRTGVELPFLKPEDVTLHTFRERNLILIGNVANNAALVPLYANYLTSADEAALSGTFVIHTVPSPFGGENSAVVIGAGDVAAARDAAAAFVALLAAEPTAELPLLHVGPEGPAQRTESPEAAEKAAEEIAGMVAKRGGRGVTAAVGRCGLRYHQTGNPLHAVSFRVASRRFFEYLAKEGHAHGDTDDFIDSTAWWMPVGLDNVEEAQELTAAERRFLTNLAYSVSHYCGSMCSNWSSLGSPVVHNHMSFPLLSSWVAGRYFAHHYNDSAARSWMWVTDVVFGRQSHSAQPQEDAGGYLRHVPDHVMQWALASGKRTYFENGGALGIAELAMAVTDNLGYESQFGDAGGARTPMQAQLLWSAAFGTGNGSLAWLAERHDIRGGRYVAELGDAAAPDISGVRCIALTPGVYDYARAFTGVPRELTGIPLSVAYHKLSLRSGLEAGDQYLLLDGLGRGYHHHEDANAIIRMTDKGMICLLDAHYTNRGPVYHNSITVVRDGQGAVFPLFSQKLIGVDLPATGFVQSLLDDYNGVGWYRHILWPKGDCFLVLDELRARKPGDYSFQCLWRTLGQATLQGREMLNRNRDGVVFHVRNADSADRLRLSHDVFGIEVERGRGEVTKLHQITNVSLASGESHTYLNLLYTDAPDRTVPTELRKVAGQAVLIRRAEELALAGLAAEGLTLGDVTIRAQMFWLTPARLALARAVSLRWPELVFEASEPVDLEIDMATGRGIVAASVPTRLITPAGGVIGGRRVGKTFEVPLGRHEIALAGIPGAHAVRRQGLQQLWAPAAAADLTAETARTAGMKAIWTFAAATFGQKRVLSKSSATTLSCDTEPCANSPWVASHAVRLSHVTDDTKDFAIWPRDASPTLSFDFGHQVQVAEVCITSYWSHVADQNMPVRPLRFTVTADDGRLVGQAAQDRDVTGKSDLRYRVDAHEVTTSRLMVRCEPRPDAAMMIREVAVLGTDPAGIAPIAAASGGVQISGLDVADVTGDGAPEVLLGTQKGRLVLLGPDGAVLLDTTLKAPVNDVALADLDGDGAFELLSGSEDSTARCFDMQGNEKWAASFRYYFRPGHVTVLRPADLDGDGSLEVVVGTFNSMTHALSASGERLWDAQVYHHWTKSLDIADLDGDGSKECVFGTSYACVHVKCADGTDLWRRSAGGKFYGDVECVDLDGDGTLEVLAGSKNQCVAVWDHAGVRRFLYDTGATVNAVGAADLDGDGALEVLAGSSSFWVYALKADGTLLWSRNLGDEVLQLETGQLDHSRASSIVAGCADGRVVVLDRAGTALGQFRAAGPINLIRLADLDLDGRAEVIAASWDGKVYVLGLEPGADN